jgi:hypothetical protein
VRRARTLAALVALLSVPALAGAGPWGRSRGGLYVKTGYSYLRATELATPDGTIAPIPTFEKQEATLYAAYGLTDTITMTLGSTLYRWSRIEGFDSAGGVGDLRLGAQYRLGRSGAWLLATRGLVQVPTGDVTKGEGLLPTGSGVWEGELYLSVGRSFAGGRGWVFVEAGPQFRGGGLRDGLVYDAQVGVRVRPWLALAWNVRGVQPWDTTPGDLSAGSAAGLGDGVTYLAFGPTAIVDLRPGLGLQVALDGATHTRNIARGPTLRVGLFLSR